MQRLPLGLPAPLAVPAARGASVCCLQNGDVAPGRDADLRPGDAAQQADQVGDD